MDVLIRKKKKMQHSLLHLAFKNFYYNMGQIITKCSIIT